MFTLVAGRGKAELGAGGGRALPAALSSNWAALCRECSEWSDDADARVTCGDAVSEEGPIGWVRTQRSIGSQTASVYSARPDWGKLPAANAGVDLSCGGVGMVVDSSSQQKGCIGGD